jgi:hypothetical protein
MPVTRRAFHKYVNVIGGNSCRLFVSRSLAPRVCARACAFHQVQWYSNVYDSICPVHQLRTSDSGHAMGMNHDLARAIGVFCFEDFVSDVCQGSGTPFSPPPSHSFHSCTVHLDIIKVFFIFTIGCTMYLLRSTLKFTLNFTLKLLLHVSI